MTIRHARRCTLGLGLALLCGCANDKNETAPPPEPFMPIPDPVPVPEGAQASEPERIADDGRPGWWFPEVRRSSESLRLCIETIGTGSLRDANRRAVEAAYARAAIEAKRIGYELGDDAVVIEKTWSWPLPQLPGRERQYAGYAMVLVQLSEERASG